MHRFLLVVVLLLHLSSAAQIDQKKLDSLAHSIDSSARAYKRYQDSFNKVQDSVYHAALSTGTKLNNRKPDNGFEQKEREKRKKTFLRILISVFFIASVIVLLLRKKLRS